MNTKTMTLTNCKAVAEILMSAHKLISSDRTLSGLVEFYDKNGNPRPIPSVDKSMSKLETLDNFSNSYISKLVANLTNANDVVSNSEAVSTLEGICIDDVNNGYFDNNVTDSKMLEKVADSSVRYFRATPSWVKPLEAKYVNDVIKGVINDDTFMSIMKAHDPKDATKLTSMFE